MDLREIPRLMLEDQCEAELKAADTQRVKTRRCGRYWRGTTSFCRFRGVIAG